MEVQAVYEGVHSFFANYNYKLFNTYIYNWECDFFAVSKSGYQVEVEVKVSRGDFFKDFEKDKHRLFADLFAKKKFHIYRQEGWRIYHEDNLNFVCSFMQPVIEFPYGAGRSTMYGSRREWKYDYNTRKYLVNDWGEPHITHERVDVRAQYSKIHITPIETILSPHSFYYACPENLIKVEEIPKYAGLIYIRGLMDAHIVKKAPFLHKNHQNKITGILLKKFHNLWQYKSRLSVKEQIEAAAQVEEKSPEGL